MYDNKSLNRYKKDINQTLTNGSKDKLSRLAELKIKINSIKNCELKKSRTRYCELKKNDFEKLRARGCEH